MTFQNENIKIVVGYDNQFDGPFYPQHPPAPPFPPPIQRLEKHKSIQIQHKSILPTTPSPLFPPPMQRLEKHNSIQGIDQTI